MTITLSTGRNLILAVFLIISGLIMCGVSLPRWVTLVGGVCGIIAGVLILVGGGA